MNEYLYWLIIFSLVVLAIAGIVWIIFMIMRKKPTSETDYKKVFETIDSIKQDHASSDASITPDSTTEAREYDFLSGSNLPDRKFPFSFLPSKKKKYLKEMNKNKDGGVVIFMQTLQGNWKVWLQKENSEGFTFNKKQYIFDDSMKFYIENLKLWAYQYQEALDIPVSKKLNLSPSLQVLVDDIQKRIDSDFKKPIDKKISASKIRDAIDAYGLTEVEQAFDPMSLKRFIDTQVILQVMGGAWFTKIMKIVLIAVLILLVLNLFLIGGIGYIGWETYQAGKTG